MHTLEQGDLKVEFVQIFSFITSVNVKSTEKSLLNKITLIMFISSNK